MAQQRKTAAEVKKEVTARIEEIDALRERARELGLAFTSLNEKQLEKKIKGQTSRSPYIYAQSWTSGAAAGSSASYSVYVSNPDPLSYFPFYASIFFGLGNFFPVRDGWAGRDKRWPEFSSDRTYLSTGSTATFTFNYTIPTGLPPGTYNGNTVIWEGEWHDVGTSFDRGSFDVRVS